MTSLPSPRRRPCFVVTGLLMCLTAGLLSGCAVVAVAGTAVGAAVAVTGAVVSTAVTVTGKAAGAAVDAVSGDDDDDDDDDDD